MRNLAIPLVLLLVSCIVFKGVHSSCPYIKQSVYNGHIQQPQNATPGDDAIVSCEDPYVISNRRNNNRTILKCQSNGTWDGRIPNCKLCGTNLASNFSLPNNTHWNFSDATADLAKDGSTAMLECDIGWRKFEQSVFHQITCLLGSWMGNQNVTMNCILASVCLKKGLSSVPMKNGSYTFSPESTSDLIQNGTLVGVECDKGYRMMKKTANGDHIQTGFNDSDGVLCNYGVWVGRKATDLGYKCEPMGKVLLIGAISADGDKIMELYDTEQPGNNALVTTTQLSVARFGHVSGVFDDGLVAIAGGIIGGTGGEYTSDTVFYDPKVDQLTSGDAMSVNRGYAGSAMLDNMMIVCGGFDLVSNTIHKTCERLYFDESANPIPYKWDSSFTSMNTARYNYAMTQYKNELFVIGGHTGVAVNTAERYSKTTNTWVSIVNMPTARYALSAAGLGDFIYACGGSAGSKLCEKYNPGTNMWGNATSMNTGGSGFTLIPMEREGKMYAFTDTKVVELFDPTTSMWTTSTSMLESREYGEAVQLKPAIV